MKPLIITALLAAAAPAADAGDLEFRFGYHRHGGIRIGVGYRSGRRHRRGHRHGHRYDHYCHRHWERGYHETVRTRVWVPGYDERVYRPARYETRYDECGNRVRVLVRRAGYRTVHVAGRYELETRRVFRPGRWVYRCNTSGHRH